jgi:transketolase
MPCTEAFDAQPAAYRADILPADALIVSIEAGSTFGWQRYTGLDGLVSASTASARRAPPKTCTSISG